MRKQAQAILAAALSLIAISAAGDGAIATVTASGPVKLDGRAVPGTAARALPVGEKAWIETGESTAVMAFPESGRIVTKKDSKIKTWMEKVENGAPGQALQGAAAANPLRAVCLTKGFIRFEAARNAEMMICARNQRILASPDAEGSVFISEQDNKVYAHADRGTFKTESKENCGCGLFPGAVFSMSGTAGLTKASAAGIVGGLVTTRGVGDKPKPLSAAVD